MKNFIIVVASVCAFGLLAGAAPPIADLAEGQVKTAEGWRVGSKNTPVKVDGVLYIDQRAANPGNVGGCDGGVGICYIGKGKLEYDFPALSGQNEVATSNVCAVSPSVTVTGCAFGDTLSLGMDQAAQNAFISFTPRMKSADTAEIQACCNGINDAGSCDQGDSGFIVRCFR